MTSPQRSFRFPWLLGARPCRLGVAPCLAASLLAAGCGDDVTGASGGGAGASGAGGSPGADAGLAKGGSGAPTVIPEPFDARGCDAPELAPGDNPTLEIDHGGESRQYVLYVPEGVDPAAPTPVVLNWHGLTSNAQQQQAFAGNAIADARRHIVAYPNGLGNPGGQSFNGGVCCSQLGSPSHEADDVGFGRAIVADIAGKICVDRRRVYSTGMSNGGYMSEHNACEAADFYAAVAPVSALGILRAECAPARPVPILAFNGTDDALVSYDVSQQSMAAWAERNGCTEGPERKEHGGSFCDTWSACANDVEVTACTITGMNHCWPGQPLTVPGFCASGGLEDIDANAMMYDFFARFALEN